MLFPLVIFLHKNVRRLLALSEARVDSYNRLSRPLSSSCPGMGIYMEPGERVTKGSLNPLVDMAHIVLMSLKGLNVWIMTYWGWKCPPWGKFPQGLARYSNNHAETISFCVTRTFGKPLDTCDNRYHMRQAASKVLGIQVNLYKPVLGSIKLQYYKYKLIAMVVT